MKPFYQAPLKVKPSSIHGYGVFADADIDQGAIIEECHILAIHDQTTFFNYLFQYPLNGNKDCCLALGFGSLYNHADTPNADYHFDQENSRLVFTAMHPIKSGEEIFINYGENWFSKRNAKAKQASLTWRIKQVVKKSRFIIRGLLCTAAVYAVIVAGHVVLAK